MGIHYTVKCFDSWDDALKEAKAYVAGKRLRKAYIYSAKEHRIVQVRHWVRKDFANFTNKLENTCSLSEYCLACCEPKDKRKYYNQFEFKLIVTV